MAFVELLQGVPAAVIVPLACAVYVIWTLIYNVYFHALRHIPGPRLAAASRLYEFYYEVIKQPGGQYIWEVDRLHGIYGPIVRISPREVHIKDPEFFDKFILHRGKVDKDPNFCQILGTPLSMFATSPHDEHKIRRQAASPAFSRASITALEPKLVSKMARLRQLLDGYAERDEPFNIRDAVVCVTMDVSSEWMFGERVMTLGEDKLNHHWEAMMAGMGEAVPLAKNVPGTVAFFQKLPYGVLNAINPLVASWLELGEWIRGPVGQQRARWQEDSQRPYAEKTANDPTPGQLEAVDTPGPKPMIRTILNSSSLPMSEKGEERMRQECVGILAGANDTTSSALANTIFYILDSDPSLNIIQRIREELSSVQSEPFEWRQLEKLPFLTAVVKEGLRISAIATTRLPRIRPDPIEYKNYIIPGGAVVSMCTPDMLHDPAVYPEPMAFKPDRWLDADEAQRKLMERSFVPFSRGPRMCIGFTFAYMEMYHFLANFIGSFDLELSNTVFERDVKTLRDCLVAKTDKSSKGVFVKIKGRRNIHD